LLIHFDYDGVLVDSLDQLLDLAQRAQREMGAGRLPRADDFRTLGNLTLIGLGIAIGIPQERAAEFAAETFRLLREDSRIPAFQTGICEVLERLNRKHTLVVMTANSEEVVRKALQQSGMGAFIQAIFDGETSDAKSEKIKASMKNFGFTGNQTYMVGDAFSDIKEGKKAGVKTIAVTWGYQPRERLLKAIPDYIVDTPGEILNLLER